MKSKSMNFIVKLNVFPFDIMISLGQSDEELKKELKKYRVVFEDDMKLVGHGRFWMDSRNRSLIRVSEFDSSCEDFATLQHEIFHVVTHILDRMGVKFVLNKSDEVYSYLIGYVTKEVYKKVFNKNRKS